MLKTDFLTELEEKFPAWGKIYDYGELPDSFLLTSKIYIDCKYHGVFVKKAHWHRAGQGCPECQLASREMTIDSFIKSLDPTKVGNVVLAKTKFTSFKAPVELFCSKHGYFEFYKALRNQNRFLCGKCGIEHNNEIKFQNLLKKAVQKHSNFYDYSKVEYKKFGDAVTIICPVHGEFRQNFYLHAHNGCKCKRCVIEADRLSKEEVLKRCFDIHGDRYDYSKMEFVTGDDRVTIVCKKHGEFTQRLSSHLEGVRCRDCYVEDSWLGKEEFISQARKIHGDKFDYSKVIYHGSKVPVEIICPIHGSFRLKPNAHVSSRGGCPRCKESKGETAVARALETLGIRYQQEVKVPPFKYRYDFFLKEHGVFIEFHGRQHYIHNPLFGDEKDFKKLQENDARKIEIVKDLKLDIIVLHFSVLSKNCVLETLVSRLSKIRKYWFNVNGELRSFKTYIKVREFFGIPISVLSNRLTGWLKKHHPTVNLIDLKTHVPPKS